MKFGVNVAAQACSSADPEVCRPATQIWRVTLAEKPAGFLADHALAVVGDNVTMAFELSPHAGLAQPGGDVEPAHRVITTRSR